MYNISRYEEKSDALFIRIDSTDKPVCIEHFFTVDERKDDTSIKTTIEKLVAQLEIKADEYTEPEKFVSKLDDIKNVTLDTKKIADFKTSILAEREIIEPVVVVKG